MKTSSHSFETTLPFSEESETIKITFTHYPGCRGSRDKYGVPLEPDDEPEIEITSVEDIHTGEELLPLSDLTFLKIEQLCWNHLDSLV